MNRERIFPNTYIFLDITISSTMIFNIHQMEFKKLLLFIACL